MAPPLYYPPEQAAPVQFVDPGQLFYNPPPAPRPPPPAPRYSPQLSMHATPQPPEAKIRPLNVDEALQFSPLASIIPFDATVIPMVNCHVRVSKGAFANQEQQAAGRQQASSMNAEAARSNGQSLQHSAALHGLVDMLKKTQETYSFRLPAGVARPKEGAPGVRAKLSALATSLMHRCPSQIKYDYVPVESKPAPKAPTPLPPASRKASDTPKAQPSPAPGKARPPQSHSAEKQVTRPSRPSPQQPKRPPPASSPSLQLQSQLGPQPSSSLQPQPQPPPRPIPQVSLIHRLNEQAVSANALDSPSQTPNTPGEFPAPARPPRENSTQPRPQVKVQVKSEQPQQPQQPRLVPAVRVPPVPGELQSTTPSSVQHSALPPDTYIPTQPQPDQEPEILPPQQTSSQPSSQPTFQVRIPPVSAQHRHAVQIADPITAKPHSQPHPQLQHQSSGFSIVIPGAPLSDPRDAYKTYTQDPGHRQYNHHQRAASDATLQDLQNVLNDIFEAESEAQAAGLNSNTEGILTSTSGPEGELITLAPSVLVKLDSSLRKVIERRRFSAITVDQVLQLQGLCERSLACADNMHLNLQSDWPSLEDSARNEQSVSCAQFLKAARVILRTMASGNADKRMLPEERLTKCITLLTKVVDNLILPTVEARSTGPDSTIFQLASNHKKQINEILWECNKLMQILIEVLSKEEIAETAVNQVEYFVVRMLFVENGPSEKESVLGIARFEGFRRLAMLVLVEIFTRYPDQRQFIISEVLSSLQKLPTARQQGRQFKLDNGKRLQLVTVLLIRLVQASGTDSSSKSTRAALRAEKADLDEEEFEGSEDEDELATRPKIQDSEEDDDADDDLIPKRLVKTVRKLYDSAVKSAWHIVSFLVQRASTASKTGEQPHRHLLDMFVEDLINVLGMAEWPGAEIILHLLVNKMKDFVVTDKTPAPIKTMALETLGTLGTAILDITFEAQHVARALENDGSDLSSKLIEQLDNHLQGQLSDFEIVNWKGPFRAVMDNLETKSSEGQASSASSFILTRWTKTLLWGSKHIDKDLDEKRLVGGARDLGISLCRMTAGSKWNDSDPLDVEEAQARLAYYISILHIGFCQAFPHIVSMLLSAINSDQITVRARALKSVTMMLEKDPALLDRYPQVMHLIMRCATDPSASVRDNSLNLLGKCITLRPSIEKDVIQTILHATSDQTIGIRKRALKLLREAYQRDDSNKSQSEKYAEWRRNVRSLAANSIFRRASDEEVTVVELVQQIFEEIWIDPFREVAKMDSGAVTKSIPLKDQMAFMIQTVCDHEDFAKPVQDLIKRALSDKGKNAESTTKVCKALVTVSFEGIINPEELPGAPPQHRVLQALAIFARTQPKLFTPDHVELLKPYVSCLSTGDDLNLFRGVVVIFRCVLPTLPTLQHETLKKVQQDLLTVVSKLPKAELDEVASCLWTISKTLQSPNSLVKLTISVLNNLQKLAAVTELNDDALSKAQRLMRIAGHFGKHCDFQSALATFQKALPGLKGDLVAGKIVSGLQPFTSAKRPLPCKAVAWEAIGMICQSWPKTFSHEGISKDIQKILQGDEPTLQRIILTSIRDFFATQDQAHDTESNALSKDPLAQGKLGGSMTATDNDGAAALIAQAYLKHILKISLNTTEDIALIATEVAASISRQGLIHPKEVGPALFALVTSPDQKVVAVALQQLRNLHSQHETLFEREYIRSIHEAFVYQKNIVKDTAGSVGSPPRAKLHHVFEVIKESKAKFVTKFLTNFCGRADFELAKLDTTGSPPTHLEYARFLLENLPFFDFTRIDDINLVITCLEKAVAATGSIVAHAINTEVFNVTVESVLSQSGSQQNGLGDFFNGAIDNTNGDAPAQSIEQPLDLAQLPIQPAAQAKPEITLERLRLLTTAAIVLTLLWEARTHLRKLYNLNSANQAKGKGRPVKDTVRAPAKNGLVSGDKYLERIAATVKDLNTEQASTERCKAFAALMAIDDELKVGKGDEDEMEGDLEELVAEEDLGASKGRKRKQSTPNSMTPKKKRSRPSKVDSRKSSEDVDMWD